MGSPPHGAQFQRLCEQVSPERHLSGVRRGVLPGPVSQRRGEVFAVSGGNVVGLVEVPFGDLLAPVGRVQVLKEGFDCGNVSALEQGIESLTGGNGWGGARSAS